MKTFLEGCIEYIFAREGGFTNNPADNGGATNLGITLKVLSEYRGILCTVDDIKNLTKEEAAKIYELRYWNTMRLDRVRQQRIALILFDLGVNMGPAAAIKLLQSVLNESFAEKIELDGVLGNLTDVAISTAPEARLCRKLIQAAQIRYVEICVKKPAQLVFLRGWLNRTFALAEATVQTPYQPF